LRSPEQISQQWDVAKQRYFGDGFRLGVLHQSANDDGLPVGRDGDGIGRTNVDDRGIDYPEPFALAEMAIPGPESS